MTINRKRNLVVAVEDGGTFEVVLHRVWKGSAVHQDFLGFYVLDSHRMSARTHGLLGNQLGRQRYWGALWQPGGSPWLRLAAGHQGRPFSNLAIEAQSSKQGWSCSGSRPSERL